MIFSLEAFVGTKKGNGFIEACFDIHPAADQSIFQGTVALESSNLFHGFCATVSRKGIALGIEGLESESLRKSKSSIKAGASSETDEKRSFFVLHVHRAQDFSKAIGGHLPRLGEWSAEKTSTHRAGGLDKVTAFEHLCSQPARLLQSSLFHE